MSKREIEKKHERMYVNGMYINFETTEHREDGIIKKSERLVADRAYYEYLEWRERYAQGLVSDETLELILKCDDLKHFVKDGDFVRFVDGMDSATMDARIKKTREFESEWYGAMADRVKNPQSWHNTLSKIIGDVFKDYDTAEYSSGSLPVSLAGGAGSIPASANKNTGVRNAVA